MVVVHAWAPRASPLIFAERPTVAMGASLGSLCAIQGINRPDTRSAALRVLAGSRQCRQCHCMWANSEAKCRFGQFEASRGWLWVELQAQTDVSRRSQHESAGLIPRILKTALVSSGAATLCDSRSGPTNDCNLLLVGTTGQLAKDGPDSIAKCQEEYNLCVMEYNLCVSKTKHVL